MALLTLPTFLVLCFAAEGSRLALELDSFAKLYKKRPIVAKDTEEEKKGAVAMLKIAEDKEYYEKEAAAMHEVDIAEASYVPEGKQWGNLATYFTDAEITELRQEFIDEGGTPKFKAKLMQRLTFTGLATTAYTYNKLIQKLENAPNPAATWKSLTEHQTNPQAMKAVVILGPSAVGKTSSTATLMQGSRWGISFPRTPGISFPRAQLGFPAMTYDGSVWREVSDRWQHRASENGFTDMFDIVFKHGGNQSIKKMFESIFHETMKELQRLDKLPPTIIIPSTAVPCARILGQYTEKTCPILKQIRLFQKYGYKIRFLVVHAAYKSAEHMGNSRSWNEGKFYWPCSYGFAIHAVFNLFKKFGKGRDAENWMFIENRVGEEITPQWRPRNLTWEGYKAKTKCELDYYCPENCGRYCTSARWLIHSLFKRFKQKLDCGEQKEQHMQDSLVQ